MYDNCPTSVVTGGRVKMIWEQLKAPTHITTEHRCNVDVLCHFTSSAMSLLCSIPSSQI